MTATETTTGVAAATTTVVDPSSSVLLRRRVFYGVFAFLAIMYLVIVVAYLFEFRDVSGFVMRIIVQVAPTVMQDVPLVGDLVPAVLGGIIAATAPATASNRQLVTVLLLSLATYCMYLHMSVFFAIDSDQVIQTRLLKATLAGQGLDPQEAVTTLAALASSARNFAAFVFAALIGIKFNGTQISTIPFLGSKWQVKPGSEPEIVKVSDDAVPENAAPSPVPSNEFPSVDESDGLADTTAPDASSSAAKG
jgi:hypothetical protein